MAKVKLDERKFKLIRAQLVAELKRELPDLIIERSIKLGISPVKGKRKFQKYSDSYKNAIRKRKFKRKISPVNLFVTGKMLNSFRVIGTRLGVRMRFGDKKAGYHQTGNSKLPRRPLLPTRRGEQFSRIIVNNIREIIASVVSTYGK